MILVFGGAYQGKLEYVIQNHGVQENEIFTVMKPVRSIFPGESSTALRNWS